MENNVPPTALADLIALKVAGPTLVFIRPTSHLPAAAMEAVTDGFKRLRQSGAFSGLEHVRFVIVPCDFEIMAVGDTDLERCGLVRLDSLESYIPANGDR